MVLNSENTEIYQAEYRFSDERTMYMAEVKAFTKTIEYCMDKLRDKDVRIITDSLSAVQSVVNISKDRKIFKDIRINIRVYNRMRIFWTKVLIGNPENLKADELAKSATIKNNTDIEYYMNNKALNRKL